MTKRYCLLFTVILMIGFSGVFALDAQAATFTVSTTADSGAESLRQAIIDANTLASDDVINFSAALRGQSIVLVSEIVITNFGTLTINGLGADVLTIDGGPGTNRIFHTDDATATITNLTLTGGGGMGLSNNELGGAIYNYRGNLTLNYVNVTANTARLTAGAVLSSGGGTLQISNSTFSANVSGSDCGAIFNSQNTTLIVFNSTFSGYITSNPNTFGGAICNLGFATLRSVTITNNTADSGGGIFTSSNGSLSTLNLGNTIIAGNTGRSSFPEFRNGGSTITSAGYNLVGDNAGDSVNTGDTITYQATDVRDVNPLLAPLANYGGTTPTHAFLPGSPVIDQGFSFGLTTDQRGLIRPVDNLNIANAAGGDGSDIGAFELQAAPTAASVSVSGKVTNATGRGIRNVSITMTDSAGNERTAQTTTFGYYKFESVAAGETVTITAKARRFKFNQSSMVRTTNGSISDADFVSAQ